MKHAMSLTWVYTNAKSFSADTPYSIPFSNQYLRNLFLLFLLSIISIGAWGQTDVVTLEDPKDTEWCFLIASKGAGTIKSSIDAGDFSFINYVDRNGTRITGEVNQGDIDALAGLSYPSGYPTYLDMKDVTFVGDVSINLNTLFKGLRLPYGTFTIVPSTIDFAFYSNYTKVNYNDGNNENIPIYLFLNSGGVTSAINKLGDYLAYRTIYISGTYTEADITALTSARNGVTVRTSEDSGEGGEGGEGGDDPVDPTSLAYKIANKQQLTDVPTIYLTIPDVNDIDSDLRKYDSNSVELANLYHNATIQVIDGSLENSVKHLENFTDDVEIKVRGNSTARVSNGKRPYRLKFPKKHKHDLMGDGYTKRNWTLLANAFDKSLLRNAITYHLGKYVGMPFTAGYKFVDLVINNQYRGCYQVSDHLQADKDRININEDTGWYIEYQGTRPDMLDDPNLYYNRGTSGTVLENAHNVNIKNPDCDDLTDSQIDSLKTVMNTWLNTWQGGFQAYTVGSVYGEDGWRKYNDINTAVKYCILTELTGDYDGFMTTKFYREGNDTDKLHWGPTWDKDLAYGNYGDLDNSVIANIGNSGTIGGYAIQLYSDPYFIKAMKQTMDSLVTSGLLNNIINDITSIASGLTQTRALDYEKWGDACLGIETQYGLTDYDQYVQKVKDWFNVRIPWVQSKITEMYDDIWADNKVANFTYDTSKKMGDNGFYGNTDKLLNITMSNRIFTANSWDAICLPFDVTAEQMASVFGSEYELKEYIGVSGDGSTMLFRTVVGGAIQAAVPYLIKPSKDVSDNSLFKNRMLYYPNPQIKGKNISFGNYTLQGYMFADNLETDGTVRILNTDGSTLTTPTRENDWDPISHNGAFAYIKISNGASDPLINLNAENITPVVRTQLTTLPTIYVDTQDGADVNPSSGEWVAAGIQVIDANNNLKPFTQPIGLTSAGKNILQIRGRGTASWTNTAKKSYRLQFGKDEKNELGNVTTSYKHNLMVNEDGEGVVKKRNWVLLANAGDKTLVRNALSKEIGDAVGLPFTPGYRFVDLVLNGTYVGTYQVTEFMEADANRINIDEDNGLFIQMTGSDDVAAGDHVISGADYTKPYLTIKNPEIKAKNQEAWNASFNTDIYNFDAMWAASDGTGINKESLVNWYIASEIIGNYESLSSIYAYKDVADTELSFGPLWGNETAYDNSASIDMTSTGLMNDKDDDSHNGLMTKAGKNSSWKTKIEGLWSQPWFANAVRQRWNTLYNNGALTTTLQGKVDDLAAIVNPTEGTSSQAKNFTSTTDGGAGWTISGQGITDYSKTVANDATYASEVQRLKDYLGARLPYLNVKFNALDRTIEYDVTRTDAQTYYATYNGTAANVTLKNRGTITSAYWNPITFPFNATELQMQNVFGEGFELEQFKDVENNGEKVSVLKFTAVSPKDVTAGTPYLIKPVADVNLDEQTFSGVTFNSGEASSTIVTAGYSYVGTLQPQTFSADKTHLFVGKNNTFVRLSGSATLTGARAYFTIPEAAYSKQFSLGSFDDITGISSIIIQTDADNTRIYNMNGQMVGTSWNSIPSGVYIVNGKKIVK